LGADAEVVGPRVELLRRDGSNDQVRRQRGNRLKAPIKVCGRRAFASVRRRMCLCDRAALRGVGLSSPLNLNITFSNFSIRD